MSKNISQGLVWLKLTCFGNFVISITSDLLQQVDLISREIDVKLIIYCLILSIAHLRNNIIEGGKIND